MKSLEEVFQQIENNIRSSYYMDIDILENYEENIDAGLNMSTTLDFDNLYFLRVITLDERKQRKLNEPNEVLKKLRDTNLDDFMIIELPSIIENAFKYSFMWMRQELEKKHQGIIEREQNLVIDEKLRDLYYKFDKTYYGC